MGDRQTAFRCQKQSPGTNQAPQALDNAVSQNVSGSMPNFRNLDFRPFSNKSCSSARLSLGNRKSHQPLPRLETGTLKDKDPI